MKHTAKFLATLLCLAGSNGLAQLSIYPYQPEQNLYPLLDTSKPLLSDYINNRPYAIFEVEPQSTINVSDLQLSSTTTISNGDQEWLTTSHVGYIIRIYNYYQSWDYSSSKHDTVEEALDDVKEQLSRDGITTLSERTEIYISHEYAPKGWSKSNDPSVRGVTISENFLARVTGQQELTNTMTSYLIYEALDWLSGGKCGFNASDCNWSGSSRSVSSEEWFTFSWSDELLPGQHYKINAGVQAAAPSYGLILKIKTPPAELGLHILNIGLWSPPLSGIKAAPYNVQGTSPDGGPRLLMSIDNGQSWTSSTANFPPTGGWTLWIAQDMNNDGNITQEDREVPTRYSITSSITFKRPVRPETPASITQINEPNMPGWGQ